MPSAIRGRADLAYGKIRNNVAKVPFSLIFKPNPGRWKVIPESGF
jgi:hypothetical protein